MSSLFKIQTIIRSNNLLTSVYLYFSCLWVGKPNFRNLRKACARERSAPRHYAGKSSPHVEIQRSIYCCSALIITFFFRHQIIILPTRLLSSQTTLFQFQSQLGPAVFTIRPLYNTCTISVLIAIQQPLIVRNDDTTCFWESSVCSHPSATIRNASISRPELCFI